MNSEFKDVMIVAIYEWRDAYRSKRAALWFILYLIMSMVVCYSFVITVEKIESELAKTVNLGTTQRAGNMTASLWESQAFKRILEKLVGDEKLAEKLTQTPPMAIFYGWLAMAFTPFLVILLASESLSSELSNGTVRFALFRTSRSAWVVGKAIGQWILLLLALLLSAAGAWIIGRFWMVGFDGVVAARFLVLFMVKAWIYSFAFIGITFGFSQLTRSIALSRALAVIGFMAVFILHHIANHFAGPGIRKLWEIVVILMPPAHRIGFWHYETAKIVSSISFSIGLGFLYLFAGYLVFRRKDL